MQSGHDEVFAAFLSAQYEEGMALAGASDVFELQALEGPGSRHYVVTFHCRGLVSEGGEIREADRFVAGFQFGRDYLRRADPIQTVVLFEPRGVWHPNVRAPFVCLGPIRPGTTLTDLIYRTYELLTYAKCTMREDDALNREACSWARSHRNDFPLDRRPLKRSTKMKAGASRA
jgi:hypothetical protein